MSGRPIAPAADRNTRPILEALKLEFADCGSVLEIGSGTGQHAVAVAAEMPRLVWQTSDLAENLPGIDASLEWAKLGNVAAPLLLDVDRPGAVDARYDAAFSANTAHIMGLGAVKNMIRLVADSLEPGGVFCLYGPFKQGGRFSTDSNARFDAALREQDPAMGIRDLEQLDEFASASGLSRVRAYAMPANNMLVVWEKERQRAEPADATA